MFHENSNNESHEQMTTPPIEQPMAVRDNLIQQLFRLLKNRDVSRSEKHFIISIETIDHSDMAEYIPMLLEQYEDGNEEFKDFIQGLMSNDEEQHYVKTTISGTNDRLSVSVIGTYRRKTDTIDEHKILIATMKKSIETSTWCNLFTKLFDIQSDEEKEIENIIKQLTDEENKKCLERMALSFLNDEIRTHLGYNVEVTFTETNSNGTASITDSSESI